MLNVAVSGQWMKSTYQIPFRLTSFEALTAPRGVPVAVPFDHHHSHFPLHVVTAA